MIDLYRGTPGTATEAGVVEARGEPAPRRCRWWPFAATREAPDVGAEAVDRDAEPDGAAFARTAANELELLFPRLPNPDIYIYVTPHLASGERVPVPGYTTAVPLYERVEYALPGELERAGRSRPAELNEERVTSGGSPTLGASGEGTPAPRGGETP